MAFWTKENITLGIAIVGAGLGIFNTARTVWKDGIRLKISTRIKTDGDERLAVEIVNGSFIDVEIKSISILSKRGLFRSERWVELDDCYALPRRLSPAAFIEIYPTLATTDESDFFPWDYIQVAVSTGIKTRVKVRGVAEFIRSELALHKAQSERYEAKRKELHERNLANLKQKPPGSK